MIAGWWGMPVENVPVAYDYGNNITYQNDTVYYGSKPVESALAYYNRPRLWQNRYQPLLKKTV